MSHTKENYWDHWEKGLCTKCSDLAVRGRTLCEKHLTLKKTINRKYRAKLREEFRCLSCGLPLIEEWVEEGYLTCVNCIQKLTKQRLPQYPQEAPFAYWRRAYHDAGHAVASYNLGIKFPYVPTWYEGGCLGMWKHPDEDLGTLYYCGNSAGTVPRIEETIMVRMAGHVAGKIIAGSQTWRTPGPDWDASLDLALRLGHQGKGLKVYTNSLLERTKQMLRQPENWYAVKVLAWEVMLHRLDRKIDYQEAIKMIGDAQDHCRQLVRDSKYGIDQTIPDPKEVVGYRLDGPTFVCPKCIKPDELSKIKKWQIKRRRDIERIGIFCCDRCMANNHEAPIAGLELDLETPFDFIEMQKPQKNIEFSFLT